MPASPHPAPATSWHPATTSCLCEPGPGSTPSLPRGFPVGTGEKRSPSPLLSSLLSHPLLSPVPAQKLNSPEPGGSWGSEAAPPAAPPQHPLVWGPRFWARPKGALPKRGMEQTQPFSRAPRPLQSWEAPRQAPGTSRGDFSPETPTAPCPAPSTPPRPASKPTRSGCHRPSPAVRPLPLGTGGYPGGCPRAPPAALKTPGAGEGGGKPGRGGPGAGSAGDAPGGRRAQSPRAGPGGGSGGSLARHGPARLCTAGGRPGTALPSPAGPGPPLPSRLLARGWAKPPAPIPARRREPPAASALPTPAPQKRPPKPPAAAQPHAQPVAALCPPVSLSAPREPPCHSSHCAVPITAPSPRSHRVPLAFGQTPVGTRG